MDYIILLVMQCNWVIFGYTCMTCELSKKTIPKGFQWGGNQLFRNQISNVCLVLMLF